MTRMFTAVALAVMTFAPPTSAQLLNKERRSSSATIT